MIGEGVRIGEYGSVMAAKGLPPYRRGDVSRTALAMPSIVENMPTRLPVVAKAVEIAMGK